MKQADRFRKHPVFVVTAATSILILLVAGVMFLAGNREGSVTLVYQIDTRNLCESEIEDLANEYLIPTLKRQAPEKVLEFDWQFSGNSIQVSVATDVRTIRKLKEFNQVIELQLPGYLKQKELIKQHESKKMLQQLAHMLMRYIEDNDEKLPDSLNELKPYDVSGSLPWLCANIQYCGDEKALTDLRKPMAYDKRLLQKGNGTNVLFIDNHVGFFRPDELEELGIFPAAT